MAPSQTLTDKELQRLRDASLAIIREMGVECGGSNVQMAINPEDGEMVIIEMNPRVSRCVRMKPHDASMIFSRISTPAEQHVAEAASYASCTTAHHASAYTSPVQPALHCHEAVVRDICVTDRHSGRGWDRDWASQIAAHVSTLAMDVIRIF